MKNKSLVNGNGHFGKGRVGKGVGKGVEVFKGVVGWTDGSFGGI